MKGSEGVELIKGLTQTTCFEEASEQHYSKHENVFNQGMMVNAMQTCCVLIITGCVTKI